MLKSLVHDLLLLSDVIKYSTRLASNQLHDESRDEFQPSVKFRELGGYCLSAGREAFRAHT